MTNYFSLVRQTTWVLPLQNPGKHQHYLFLNMQIPCHLLLHLLTCSQMVTFTFGDLVENQVGTPPISQPTRDFRKRLSLVVNDH